MGLLALSACGSERMPAYDGLAIADAGRKPVLPQRKPSVPSRVADVTLRGEIFGLDRTEVDARLGAPVEQQDHGVGQAMEYRDRHCSIEVTMYPEVETRIYRALAYQVTSDDHTPQSTRNCLERFTSRIRAR